ncbi:universal stress protein [Oleidesulfovibrio sp.]|uniref:universal stress protein n=1 Tax=Oleidesulfovibrio sp. TaxID=2909707 RepID=UPI003A838764
MPVSKNRPNPSIPSAPLVPKRDVLVTVSESQNHLHAAQFAAQFLHNATSVGITLLYVAPPKQQHNRGPYGLALGVGGMDDEEYNRHIALGTASLAEAEKLLLKAGVEEDRITLRSVPNTTAMDWDIMYQGVNGGHSAIALGNRGRTWLENLLEGTPDITGGLIKQSCIVPLWLCPPNPSGSQKVLICVDGSASAFNAVHHISHILGADSPHEFTLLRICKTNPCGFTDSGMLFKQCRQIMEGQGVAPERVSTSVVTHNNVVETILRLSLEGNYGLVVAGRRGMGSNLIEHLLMGAVANKLMRRLRNCALCLCC